MGAVFPSGKRTALVQHTPNRCWVFKDKPAPRSVDRPVNATQAWKDLSIAINFHTLGGEGGEAYDVWEIGAPKAFRDAMIALGGIQHIGGIVDNFIKANKRPQRALVCRMNSGPFGDYFANMISRPERAISLAVIFYGHRNANPCDCCAGRYSRNLCVPRDSSNGRPYINVNWPYFECISHPDIQHGKCANCIYHTTSDCDYNQNFGANSEHQCVRDNAAKADASPNLPPRKFANDNLTGRLHPYQSFEEARQSCITAIASDRNTG